MTLISELAGVIRLIRNMDRIIREFYRETGRLKIFHDTGISREYHKFIISIRSR